MSETPQQRDVHVTIEPLEIRSVDGSAVKRWLARGWDDFRRTQYLGAFYGVIFVLMGFAIVWVYETRWQFTMGLVSGFFLLGPFICVGIYDLSRQLEAGEKISLTKSLTCWRNNIGSIAFFAVILTFLMIVWARVSVIIFALFSSTSFPTLKGILASIFSLNNITFLTIWLLAGLVFASLVFAIGVVSGPQLLDRGDDTLRAIFTSARSLAANPAALFLWAVTVVLLIGLSLIAGFIPLVITSPVVGHATWHAYRSLVRQAQ